MAKRSIGLDIAKQNLGTLNTDEDNEAYRLAVEEAIEARFPGAAVEVCLVGDADRDVAHVRGFGESDEETGEAVREIAQDVWSEANY